MPGRTELTQKQVPDIARCCPASEFEGGRGPQIQDAGRTEPAENKFPTSPVAARHLNSREGEAREFKCPGAPGQDKPRPRPGSKEWSPQFMLQSTQGWNTRHDARNHSSFISPVAARHLNLGEGEAF